MMIAINKRFKKIPRKVWLIEGNYYDNKGRLIKPSSFYICKEHEKEFFMRSKKDQAKLPDNKLKWKRVKDITTDE